MNLRNKSTQRNRLTFSIGLAIVAAITLAGFLIPATTSQGSSHGSPAAQIALPLQQSSVPGPQLFVGCVGNQPVLIDYAIHPANTSSILYTPIAGIEANASHEYCDNGNLINATSGQTIPVAPPPPPTTITPPPSAPAPIPKP